MVAARNFLTYCVIKLILIPTVNKRLYYHITASTERMCTGVEGCFRQNN